MNCDGFTISTLFLNPDHTFLHPEYIHISKPFSVIPETNFLYPKFTFYIQTLTLLYPNPDSRNRSLVIGIEGTAWGQGKERFRDGGNCLRAGGGTGWGTG